MTNGDDAGLPTFKSEKLDMQAEIIIFFRIFGLFVHFLLIP